MNSKLENSVSNLRRELSFWDAADQQPRMFLRDDDAVDVTPELLVLTQLVVHWKIPILLAVIPKFATLELGNFASKHELIAPAVHGYSHANHALENEKKCEFGDERSFKELMVDMENGREILQNLFPDNLSILFVPPWNRICEKALVASRLVGFKGISGFGWKFVHEGQSYLNTHVDIIDWKHNKMGKSTEVIITEISKNFETSRQNGYVPIGLLTHHLVHDENVWAILGEVFEILKTNSIKWIRPELQSAS